MKIYACRDPLDPRFARAARLGTWYPYPGPGVCPECGSARQARVPPLVLEWLPGSDVVGDFTWPGGDVVVIQRVMEALQTFRGFDFKPVEIWDNPKRLRPSRTTRRTKPRVGLPYKGPPLYELWVTAWLHADAERSSLRLERVCKTCGSNFYRLEGAEARTHRYDPVTRELSERHIARTPGKGIYVAHAALGDVDIFRVVETPAWVLCTEVVREAIEARGFTNISFLEIGETF